MNKLHDSNYRHRFTCTSNLRRKNGVNYSLGLWNEAQDDGQTASFVTEYVVQLPPPSCTRRYHQADHVISNNRLIFTLRSDHDLAPHATSGDGGSPWPWPWPPPPPTHRPGTAPCTRRAATWWWSTSGRTASTRTRRRSTSSPTSSPDARCGYRSSTCPTPVRSVGASVGPVWLAPS